MTTRKPPAVKTRDALLLLALVLLVCLAFGLYALTFKTDATVEHALKQAQLVLTDTFGSPAIEQTEFKTDRKELVVLINNTSVPADLNPSDLLYMLTEQSNELLDDINLNKTNINRLTVTIKCPITNASGKAQALRIMSWSTTADRLNRAASPTLRDRTDRYRVASLMTAPRAKP